MKYKLDLTSKFGIFGIIVILIFGVWGYIYELTPQEETIDDEAIENEIPLNSPFIRIQNIEEVPDNQRKNVPNLFREQISEIDFNSEFTNVRINEALIGEVNINATVKSAFIEDEFILYGEFENLGRIDSENDFYVWLIEDIQSNVAGIFLGNLDQILDENANIAEGETEGDSQVQQEDKLDIVYISAKDFTNFKLVALTTNPNEQALNPDEILVIIDQEEN